MEIAYSAADLRRIIGQNKLAVFLAWRSTNSELRKPGVRTDAATVRAENPAASPEGDQVCIPHPPHQQQLRRDCVYNMMFSFANKRANGAHS